MNFLKYKSTLIFNSKIFTYQMRSIESEPFFKSTGAEEKHFEINLICLGERKLVE